MKGLDFAKLCHSKILPSERRVTLQQSFCQSYSGLHLLPLAPSTIWPLLPLPTIPPLSSPPNPCFSYCFSSAGNSGLSANRPSARASGYLSPATSALSTASRISATSASVSWSWREAKFSSRYLIFLVLFQYTLVAGADDEIGSGIPTQESE
jgi:hypothetical protein